MTVPYYNPIYPHLGGPPEDQLERNVFGQPRRTGEVPVRQTMPTGSAERKNVPLCTGVLDYFPAALAEVAKLSKYGNDKHNPGEPLHWARGKSMDHADCIARHLADRGVTDPDTGLSHTVEVAWRALALLQEECEARGAPMSRASRVQAPSSTQKIEVNAGYSFAGEGLDP